MLFDPAKSADPPINNLDLDMIFKKDRPFLILTDSTTMDSGSGLNLSGSSGLNLNFSDGLNFDLDSYHSIILNSN